MTTSTVARSMTTSFLSLILVFSAMATAQSVAPTNATIPSDETSPDLVLQLSGGPISLQMKNYNIVPLTSEEGKGATESQVAGISISGTLKLADATSAIDLNTTDVAFISCDPNGSNLDPSSIVNSAGALKPKAIVLYSETAESCNLTGEFDYDAIFSLTTKTDSLALMQLVGLYPPVTNILTATILPNQTTTGTPSPAASTSEEGGPAPTTAVAMSILYSITGIITLLFLVIIATGAVRAHRHPERYGPRNGFPGRPRQSRAKGLARAMLETLPIVKFGDPEPAKHGAGEVELEDGHSHTSDRAVATTAHATDSKEAPAIVESGLGAAQAGSVHSAQEAAAAATVPEEHLGCSICTEDFTTGEDVRVLPCNHKFHPACIDPWLLNVSGTCPLCRHDLRPVTSATANTDNSNPSSPTEQSVPVAEGSELPPPLLVAEGSEPSADPHRNRISRFLDLNRLRHAAPDERIAALRELREQSQREGAPEVVEDTEERSRRVRLAGRLRDTFRIRTRTQNVPT